MKLILKYLFILFLGIVIAILLRVFVFAIYTIPTPSMEPAIISGDRVIVNKLVYGSRVITSKKTSKKDKYSSYIRIPGLNKITRNDIVVFNFPHWESGDLCNNLFYVKRCVAIPKDTFYIEKGIYKVKGISDTLGCCLNQRRFYEISRDKIKKTVFDCFPYNELYNWNCKQFGPLYLPAKGDTITLTFKNVYLYKKMIEYETEKKVSSLRNSVFLDDSIIDRYIFQKNYYFMAGDYVFDSRDSRYWGPLSEDHIVGKVVFIYKSVDPKTGKNRWGRFLKSVY